jgi:hypothetical protein
MFLLKESEMRFDMSGDNRSSIEIIEVLTQLGINKDKYIALLHHEKNTAAASAPIIPASCLSTPKNALPSQKQ